MDTGYGEAELATGLTQDANYVADEVVEAASGNLSSSTELSTIRYTGKGETFVRYESENNAFSRVTLNGGVTLECSPFRRTSYIM